MSVYLVKGKGWRYDFTLKGTRHTEAWFKTKTEAKQAEAKRREELENPKPASERATDMGFLELINKRLDHVKAYKSNDYYNSYRYYAQKWLDRWGELTSGEIDSQMVEAYLLERAKKRSAFTANSELRYLRALFNFGMRPQRGWVSVNPTQGIEFLPVEKRTKYVPPKEDILRVILVADPDTQDYLWTLALTMGRMGEINRLTWEDVNLEEKWVVLYTRKKRGGHLTPRKIAMPEKLHEILSRRHARRDKRQPWVFMHRYWDRKKGEWVEGPYRDRKRIMSTLCKKAGVRYFRFHAFRHFGASLLDHGNVPLGAIQRILGHQNRSTTEIYLHSISEAERQAIRVLDCEMAENSHTDSHTETKKDSGEIT